ncbi:isopentenyl-diphosphate Delta-isomerase [Pseudarthrobacter sp. P1]|uniref:isopentenyl-diphosphate Delta-isomerase n=1 Tax=Pseudarthrobacter sp. P1 TaxID=3418418 RepID=UPI003CF8812E
MLLNDDGTPFGQAPKATVHTDAPALHLAFSCHAFDPRGQVLLTRRTLTKATWPGVWTNSFGGHPLPGEDPIVSIHRRAKTELGMEIVDIRLILPNFRYRAADATGILENEACPVFRAVAATEPDSNPDEVLQWHIADPRDVA